MAGWGNFEGDEWPSWTYLPTIPTKSLHQAKETTSSFVTRTSDDSIFTGTPGPTSNPVYIPTTPSPSPSPTSTSGIHFEDPAAQAFWDHLQPGHRIALVIGVVVAVLIIIFLSAWFCCNCCGARVRRGRQRIPDGPPREGILPLHTIHNRGPMNPSPVTPHPQPVMRPMLTGDVPPPSYDEAVPHNQRLQRGLSIRTTADDGVIADGKTPLSEIVFEDVEINHTNSASSASRTFQQAHHGWGDTRGHTNS